MQLKYRSFIGDIVIPNPQTPQIEIVSRDGLRSALRPGFAHRKNRRKLNIFSSVRINL
jgi:hypothetical protein